MLPSLLNISAQASGSQEYWACTEVKPAGQGENWEWDKIPPEWEHVQEDTSGQKGVSQCTVAGWRRLCRTSRLRSWNSLSVLGEGLLQTLTSSGSQGWGRRTCLACRYCLSCAFSTWFVNVQSWVLWSDNLFNSTPERNCLDLLNPCYHQQVKIMLETIFRPRVPMDHTGALPQLTEVHDSSRSHVCGYLFSSGTLI